jgi:23S rRNA (adenine2503-C2)-methyltransferase
MEGPAAFVSPSLGRRAVDRRESGLLLSHAMQPIADPSPEPQPPVSEPGEPAAPRGASADPPAEARDASAAPRPRRRTGPPSLFGLTPDEFGSRLVEHGHPRYRGHQVLDWVYRKRVRDPERMTNVSRKLRESLAGLVSLALPEVAEVRVSRAQDAAKFVLRLHDGERIESVAMRSRRGVTLCLSSQAGCGMRCAFCATGAMGLRRNLRPEEIVAQVAHMLEATGWEDPGYNLVFMGMGEPLANYAQVVKAIRILNHQDGLAVGARRITVSTVGLVPQIRRLSREGMQLGLAISLHATTDEKRRQIVPLNERYGIEDILAAARDYAAKLGRRVTIEYVLLAGENDTHDDANRLAALARSVPCKVNLIPYNPVPHLPWKRPTEPTVQRFADWLAPRSPAVTVRWSQGTDIWAACGQLGSRASGR